LTPRYNRKGRWRGGFTTQAHPVISPGVAILKISAASQDLLRKAPLLKPGLIKERGGIL
jgi:hypothetical protein